MERSLKIEVNDKIITKAIDLKVIKLTGELAMNNSVNLKSTLEPLIDKGIIYMVLDMTDLRFIDSIGTLNLINIHIKTKRRGGNMAIVGINSHIREIFEAVGLTKMIMVYDTVDTAITEVKQKK